MAGKSKSSNGSTKQSEDTEKTVDDAGTEPSEVTAETESEGKSDGVDSGTETDESGVEAESGEIADSAAEVEDAELAEEQEPADTDTSVPGVIPAHVDAPEAPPSPPAPMPVVRQGPGFFPLTLGGLLAGAIGFLVATFAVPEGWPTGVTPTETMPDREIAAAVEEQGERLEALMADVAALRDTPAGEGADLTPLSDQIAAVEGQVSEAVAAIRGRLDGLQQEMGAFSERLTAVEERPAAAQGPDGSAAMEAQLESFRQQLDDVTADAEARIAEAQSRASEIEAEAAAAAEAAEREAALASLRAALESGSAFTEPLAMIEGAPDALSSVAESGVPTLASLQAGFPPAARAALAQAQTVPEDASAGERFVAFLNRQTNARSLAPREGDDADAILSRAEAALAEGDLRTAISELEALPDDAKAVMSDWISAATARAEALDAVGALETGSN